MDKFKEKYLTDYQRARYALKGELKKKQTFWVKIRVMWYRRKLETIRTRQFVGRGK